MKKIEKPPIKFPKKPLVLNGLPKKSVPPPLPPDFETNRSKYIDPSKLGYKPPNIFPSYRKEDNNERYSLYKKPQKYPNSKEIKYMGNGYKPKSTFDKTPYMGYDAPAQSYTPSYVSQSNKQNLDYYSSYAAQPITEPSYTPYYDPKDEPDTMYAYPTYGNDDYTENYN